MDKLKECKNMYLLTYKNEETGKEYLMSLSVA